MIDFHHVKARIVGGITICALMMMGFAPAAFALENTDGSNDGSNDVAKLSEEQLETAALDFTITQGMDFTANAGNGHWDESATVQDNGYAWDADSNTLTLGNVFINIDSADKLVSAKSVLSGNSNVLCAIVLPAGATIKFVDGSEPSIVVEIENPTTPVAGIYCKGSLTCNLNGANPSITTITNGTKTTVSIEADGKEIGFKGPGTFGIMSTVTHESNNPGLMSAQENTAGISSLSGEELVDLYGIWAPDAEIAVEEDAFVKVVASGDEDEGQNTDKIVAAYVKSVFLYGEGDESGFADPQNKLILSARGNSFSETCGLWSTSTDPELNQIVALNDSLFDSFGTDHAFVFNSNEPHVGLGAGYENPYVGLQTPSLDPSDVPDTVFWLPSDKEGANVPASELNYRHICFEPVSFSKISVAPAKATLSPGDTISFGVYAQANYPAEFPSDQDISALIGTTWELSGNKSTLTVLDGGTLHVAINEAANRLDVTATPGEMFWLSFDDSLWDPATAVVRIVHSSGTPSVPPVAGDSVPESPNSPGSDGSGLLAQTGDTTMSTTVELVSLASVAAVAILISWIILRAKRKALR